MCEHIQKNVDFIEKDWNVKIPENCPYEKNAAIYTHALMKWRLYSQPWASSAGS